MSWESVAWESLAELVDRTWAADRRRLRQQLRDIEQRARRGQPFDRSLSRWQDETAASIDRAAVRRQQRPNVRFDNDLPVTARRAEIAAAIAAHQVVVVCGETGSGKSTQLPKICLEMGRGVDGLIGHTQPRRIAARSIATRIASELGTPLGRDVGFKVRFTDATDPQTYIKLMTDGILLAESQHDRTLAAYDTLIIDEAHERSLNIDFLLGFLHRLLPARPDLKLIVTSATIDAERFAEHFRPLAGNVPIVSVTGRTYPVEVRYRPLPTEASDGRPEWLVGVLAALDELMSLEPGDILVFLPTEQDIHTTAKALRGGRVGRCQVIPLYARLPTAEQQQVFEQHAGQRIVLATNVAESSLTVPGVRYVIDTGTARISRYSARQKVQRLPIEPISRASADQRAGRCGRVGPGVCVRLYDADDYAARPAYTPPEIQRRNLAAVILQALALRLGKIEAFPFLDRPRPESVRDGHATLYELGAIDDRGQLTALGQALSRLPIDPRLARMVLAADEQGSVYEVLIIAAALSVQDPRDRPLEHQQAADDAHQRYADPASDFLTYLKLWDHVHELKEHLGRRALERALRDDFLSPARVREWLEVHRQLLKVVAAAGLTVGPRRNDYDAIHRALLAGLLSSVAVRGRGAEYIVAGGLKAAIWPGSPLADERPRWLMAAEMIETSRRYLRGVARIQPRWIEQAAQHLLERTHYDEFWEPRHGRALVLEDAQLYEMIVVRGRQVPVARVDRQRAREMFIQHALIRGDCSTRGKFLAHNQELVRELRRLQQKTRQPDLLRGYEARYEFYDQRLPPEICDLSSFERWRYQAERGDPRLLFFRPSDLLAESERVLDPQAWPEALFVRSLRLPLDYRFDPGAAHDGVTLTVPVEALGTLDERRLDWLVPGLLEEKVLALIRALPKPVRVLFVPAPETARQVAEALPFGEGVLASGVARELARLGGQPIGADAFAAARLADHLRMRVRVVDAEGRELASGRELAVLQRELAAQFGGHATTIDHAPWTRDDVQTWDFGDLPDEVAVRRVGLTLVGYPTLVDTGRSVGLRLANAPAQARQQLRAGVRRLALTKLEPELRPLVDWLPAWKQWQLWSLPLRLSPGLRMQLTVLAADRALFVDREPPRTAAAFDEALSTARSRLTVAVQDVAALVGPILETYHEAQLALEEATTGPWRGPAEEMLEQLVQLLPRDAFLVTPWLWLQQLPRYLRAMLVRLERLSAGSYERDTQAAALVAGHWSRCVELQRQHRARGVYDSALELYRWMLEEYRVSLFAQKLGTSVSVSEKRLSEQWRKVGAE